MPRRLPLIAWGLGLGLLLLGGPDLAGAAPAEPRAGQIRYVGGDQSLFLDRGARDGLAPGMTLAATRDGRPAGTLEVLEVSDDRARARARDEALAPRAGDRFLLPAPAPRPAEAPTVPAADGPTPPGPGQAQASATSDAALIAAWQQAVAAQPPQPAPTPAAGAGVGQGAAAGRVRGEVGVRYRTRAYGEATPTGLNEARLALALRAKDLAGVRGLELQLRGDVDGRLDQQADRYRSGDRLLLRVRELFLGYAPGQLGVAARAGRFRTAAAPGPLDGAAVGWRGAGWALSGWGGWRPTVQELTPRTDVQAFGGELALRRKVGGGHWRGLLGALGDSSAGTLQRQALTVDNRFDWGERLLIEQTAMVDTVLRHPDGDEVGPALEQVGVLLRGRPGERLALQLEARRSEQHLLAEEADGLPDEWLDELEGSSNSRVELQGEWTLGVRGRLRPYVYWQRLEPAELAVVAGGLALGVDPAAGRGLGWTLAADYGAGWQQQLNVSGDFTWSRSPALLLGGGWRSLWTQGLDSYQHALRHLLELRLQRELRPGLRLGVELAGLASHGVSSEALEPSELAWLGQLTLAYRH